MLERRPALGKGLSALIPDAPEPIRTGTMEVDIDLLSPNEQQPRLTMDDARLEELAQSIKVKRNHSADSCASRWCGISHHRRRASMACRAARWPAARYLSSSEMSLKVTSSCSSSL